jgi:hypothetical protein
MGISTRTIGTVPSRRSASNPGALARAIHGAPATPSAVAAITTSNRKPSADSANALASGPRPLARSLA